MTDSGDILTYCSSICYEHTRPRCLPAKTGHGQHSQHAENQKSYAPDRIRPQHNFVDAFPISEPSLDGLDRHIYLKPAYCASRRDRLLETHPLAFSVIWWMSHAWPHDKPNAVCLARYVHKPSRFGMR